MTTDGGALLLRQVEGKIGLSCRLPAGFRDEREPARVETLPRGDAGAAP